jgi:DNA-binding phage protein
MALTRSFKETVRERAAEDPDFRAELLKEAINSLLAGDLATGKIVLRDYINATIGFEELATLTNKSPKSLMRMLGPRGNPQARNLLEIVTHLQDKEGLRLEVHSSRRG